MVEKKTNYKKQSHESHIWIIFWGVFFILLVINFIGPAFGLNNLYWLLFLHMGITIFSFLIIIYSLRLPEKAMKYVILGGAIWIIIESILFLSHIFEEYIWLQSNLIIWLASIFGILMIMKGFVEAVK